MEIEIGERFMKLRQRLDELEGLSSDCNNLIKTMESDMQSPISARVTWQQGTFNNPLICSLHIDDNIFPIREMIARYLQRVDAEIFSTKELIKRL